MSEPIAERLRALSTCDHTTELLAIAEECERIGEAIYGYTHDAYLRRLADELYSRRADALAGRAK